jgi:hypothetical protein
MTDTTTKVREHHRVTNFTNRIKSVDRGGKLDTERRLNSSIPGPSNPRGNADCRIGADTKITCVCGIAESTHVHLERS